MKRLFAFFVFEFYQFYNISLNIGDFFEIKIKYNARIYSKDSVF